MLKNHSHSPATLLRMLLLALAAIGILPALAVASSPKKDETIHAEPAKNVPLVMGSAGSYLSSQFARQNGDVDSAIGYLSEALKKNPDNAGLASQLLSMYVIKGDMKNALEVATRLNTLSRKDTLAELMLITELVKKNDYTGASKKLAASFEDANGQLWIPLVDEWLDAGKDRIKQPMRIEEMPVTVGRAAAIINYHVALINAYAGFDAQAAANFADAMEEPDATPMRVAQYVRSFSDNHPQFAKLKDILKQYQDSHAAALPPIESPVKTPTDGIAEVLYTMGSVMQMAGVRHDAAVYMQLARYLRPDFHLASFSLAELLGDGGAFERANDVLATIPPESQYSTRALLRQAMMLDRMGKTKEALELLATLAARDPKSTDPWVAKGDLLRVHDRFLEASIAYGEAISRIGEPTAQDWTIYYARGACMERLNRWSEAKADLQKSLSLNPNQPDVLNYLGYGLISRGESLSEAKAMLEKALAGSPNDPQIIDSMGWALYLTGEYKDALPYLERAVELLASDATVNDHLGDTYWQLGRKNEARFQWQRALTFNPSEDETKKIQAKLVSGLPSATGQPAKTTSASSTPVAPANP